MAMASWPPHATCFLHTAISQIEQVVNEPRFCVKRRDERACATGGGFSMPQAAPTSMGYHSCDCIEEGNIQQTGIEGVTAHVCIRHVIRPDRDQPKPPLF